MRRPARTVPPAGRVGLVVLAAVSTAPGAAPSAGQRRLREALGKLPYAIVYETCRRGNWELCKMAADGSRAVNLTNTPSVHELFPHASPDGKRLCFVADETRHRSKVRSVYVMSVSGAGRTLVARNARQPCWGPDGRLLYTKGEYERFTYSSYGTKGLFFYDPTARRHTPHANGSLLHVTYLCWSPLGRWIFGTVHGGMGYEHANLAIEAAGAGVFPVRGVHGCRMDVRPDGKAVLWNASDRAIVVADLDLSSRPPRVANVRTVLQCDREHMLYHGDWSPDGRYIAFSYGPNGPQHVGLRARRWHICVADAAEPNVWVTLTTDGESNKEPDWVPAASPSASSRQ